MAQSEVGPIGRENLANYAIATTFRLYMAPWNNKNLATCKLCGIGCRKKEGISIGIVRSALSYSKLRRAYLCPTCYKNIEAIVDADGRFEKLPLPGSALNSSYARKAWKNHVNVLHPFKAAPPPFTSATPVVISTGTHTLPIDDLI